MSIASTEMKNRPLAIILFIKFLGRRPAYPTTKNGYEWDGHLARPTYFYKRSIGSNGHAELLQRKTAELLKVNQSTISRALENSYTDVHRAIDALKKGKTREAVSCSDNSESAKCDRHFICNLYSLG